MPVSTAASTLLILLVKFIYSRDFVIIDLCRISSSDYVYTNDDFKLRLGWTKLQQTL